MNVRVFSHALLVTAVVLGVAACGDDEEASSNSSPEPTASTEGQTSPPSGGEYEHPTGADEVVISYAEVGGFVPREVAFQQTPVLLVSGDGRAFAPGAQIAIYPAPLLPAVQTRSISEAGVQELLAAADGAGLLQQVDYDDPTNIADASTARVVINVNGETFVHEAYALGIGPPGGADETSPERQALADFIAQLQDLETLVGTDELGEQEIFEPSAYGIEAVEVDDLSAYGSDGIEPIVVDWPDEVPVALVDASTCTSVAADEVGELFADANQLTFFADEGVTYQVFVRPILPGDECA